MKRPVLVGLAAVLALLASACIPKDPGPTGLYRGQQSDITPVVTPKASPVTWGSAPAIDPQYGGTIYAGTSNAQADPRPALLAGQREPLRLWVADPKNGQTDRPAIIWLHGGGFVAGIDSMYGLAADVGANYAKRGYVSLSVEYRTDTTLIDDGPGGPEGICPWVRDHQAPGDPVWEARQTRCEANIRAAAQDVLGAVRWVRTHAADYGIDPARVAVGGFSAGAVLSDVTAYEHDNVGTNTYFTGDDHSAEKSRVQAAIGASGCVFTAYFAPPTTIGTGDSPTSFIHSEFDKPVPYSCAAATVKAARDAGLVAELTSYCGQSGHAGALYRANQDDTDEQWTTFLVRQLNLYTDTRPPTAAPLCSGFG